LSYDSDDDDAVVPSAGCTGGFVAPDTRLPPASSLLVDSNDKLIRNIQELAGGDTETQTELLQEQRNAAVGRLGAISPFARDLLAICERL
jgi:hypothetical protein